eukprot:COSAG02_NODE_441_length_22281_cov_6.119556_23_plen_73_part_00
MSLSLGSLARAHGTCIVHVATSTSSTSVVNCVNTPNALYSTGSVRVRVLVPSLYGTVHTATSTTLEHELYYI